MQIVGSFFVRQVHKVASEVSFGVLVVHSGSRVKRLVDVTHIVDQEPHRCRLSIQFRVVLVGIVHDHGVFIAVLVAWVLLEPVYQGTDDFSDVVIVECEVVVANFSAFVEEWLVNKVPAFLVLTSGLSLDEVGVGGALSEWMVLLIDSPIWVSLFQLAQNLKH